MIRKEFLEATSQLPANLDNTLNEVQRVIKSKA